MFIISALFVITFVITFGIDAYKYNTGIYIGSAPLDLYLLVRAIEFIIPSIIFFIIAIIGKKFFNKKN